MARLILSMDGLVLKEIPLRKERLSIGRKPHNDIQIDNLTISGEHAAIVTILNDSFLEDLDSTNGTQVNGMPVKRHFLRHNDVIELGKYRLKYLVDAPAGNGGSADASPLPAFDPAGQPFAEPVPAEAPAAAVGAIQLLSGSNAGKELPLIKSLTTLGKPGVQVAVIARRAQGYFLSHIEGARFPLLNGSPIDAQAKLLSDHDVIEIAGVKMEFFFKS